MQSSCCAVGTLSLRRMSVGRPRVTVLVRCVFVGTECLLMCGVSGDRCTGFTFVRWLFGGCMVGLLLFFVPMLLSFLATPGLCAFSL